MKSIWLKFILCYWLLLSMGCAVSPPITHQYRLSSYSQENFKHHPAQVSILITKPEAAAGYQTEEMLYTQKPFELLAFAHNGWIAPPADMLLPLIVQSLNATGYFKAIASPTTSEPTDYQLDTQLISLHQSFLTKPSMLEFRAKIVLYDTKNNRILASRVIEERIPCASNDPYAGVVAANQATAKFTAKLTNFVIKHI